MEKADLTELQYITSINNVPSIIEHGILSYNQVKNKNINHHSVSMSEVQDRRKNKTITGGKPLHDYANLYLSARNPMLFKRKSLHKELCILRIKISVLDIEGSVISTGNAASDYTAFYPSHRGLEMLDKNLVFAEYWTDDDPIIQRKKTVAKCAEVLIPERVPSTLIFGAYVSCEDSKKTLNKLSPLLEAQLNLGMYFLKK